MHNRPLAITASGGVVQPRNTTMTPHFHADHSSVPPVPFILDGEMLRRVNEQQDYRYRQRQTYLQEDDRIEIIRRILAGEKQSDLSREFGVTRAAICNTFKNRDTIVTRSRHVYEAQCAQAAVNESDMTISRDPIKREPRETDRVYPTVTVNETSSYRSYAERSTALKKRKSGDVWPIERVDKRSRAPAVPVDSLRGHQQLELEAHGVQPRQVSPLAESTQGQWATTAGRTQSSHVGVGEIQECQSSAARLLVTQLLDPRTQPKHFRILADRLIRLLLEEVSLSLTYQLRGHLSIRRGPVIAVGVGDGGYPMLRCYQAMYPDQAVGLIRVNVDSKQDTRMEVNLPPATRTARWILLMTSECSTGKTICKAIRALLHWGIDESIICLVSIFVSVQALTRCRGLVSAVHGIVGAVVGPTDQVSLVKRSDVHHLCGFVGRYYHVDSFVE